MSRTLYRLLCGGAVLVVCASLSATSSYADNISTVPVDRQVNTVPPAAQADPCRGNPTELCVSTAGGQTGDQAFLHFALSSLPAGARTTGLELKLTPAGDTAGNANSGSASLQACVLTQPIPATWDPSGVPPRYDCNLGHAAGKLSANGSWSFDLAPMISVWKGLGYSGATILPNPAASPAPAPLPVTPAAWSLSFDKSRTSAQATYQPPIPVSPASSSSSDAAGAPLLAAPQVVILAPPDLALPTGPAPTPAASIPSVAPPFVAPAVILSRPIIRRQWLLVALALGAAAVGALVGSTAQQLVRTDFTLAGISAAFSASRSRMAGAIAVLVITAAVALGSTGSSILVQQGGR